MAVRNIARIGSEWIVPLALVLLWEALSRAGLIASNVLPPPSAVAVAGWRSLQSGELLHHMWISSLRALSGLLVGGLISRRDLGQFEPVRRDDRQYPAAGTASGAVLKSAGRHVRPVVFFRPGSGAIRPPPGSVPLCLKAGNTT